MLLLLNQIPTPDFIDFDENKKSTALWIIDVSNNFIFSSSNINSCESRNN